MKFVNILSIIIIVCIVAVLTFLTLNYIKFGGREIEVLGPPATIEVNEVGEEVIPDGFFLVVPDPDFVSEFEPPTGIAPSVEITPPVEVEEKPSWMYLHPDPVEREKIEKVLDELGIEWNQL